MSAVNCDTLSAGLISAEQALDHMIQAAKPLTDIETIGLTETLNRVLAEDAISTINVPPLDNSAMDGYAINASESINGQNKMAVSQRICAGDVGLPLEQNTAARIFTGAPIPVNANAVIMQEQITLEDDHVVFDGHIAQGSNVRSAGEDIANGDTILTAGRRLRGQEMGLLASIGLNKLSVYRQLTVALFFTGDELIEPGEALQEGKIYDSNRYTLRGLLQAMNCKVIDMGIVGDTLEQTREALLKATSQADLVITSGGVSVGEEDHVRIALEELGQLSMWRIAMKPGKPLAFGDVKGTPFIGLPGNPVSVFATFHLFAAAFIKKMQGMTDFMPHKLSTLANFEIKHKGARQEYIRVRLTMDDEGQTWADSFPHQGSGVLTSTSWASGFVIIEIGRTIEKGDRVTYLPFKELL